MRIPRCHRSRYATYSERDFDRPDLGARVFGGDEGVEVFGNDRG